MLKYVSGLTKLSSPCLSFVSSIDATFSYPVTCISSSLGKNNLKLGNTYRSSRTICAARRRVRYDEEEEEEDEYGHNSEIAMLEYYSQSVQQEALIVKAEVDGQEVEVLIFKGFSSSLSHRTSPDPSRSILPRRAAIKSIDRVKGPFNPSNIEYIERGMSWETFKSTRFKNN